MTGKEFERIFCEILKKIGFWALNIPKNESGAQPFDVVAIKQDGFNTLCYAIDCKVCKANRFPLDRIEDNQWLALNDFKKKVGFCARCAIVILHEKKIYKINLEDLTKAQKAGKSSIGFLDSDECLPKKYEGDPFANLWFDEEDIFKMIGKELV